MRVTSVEIHQVDSSGEPLGGTSSVAVLSFRDPQRLNPYNIKALLGLDVDEIVPRFYGIAGKSAAKNYSLSMEQRIIVARIQLNPNFSNNESYSDLRDNLYKFIASSRSGLVQLRFKDANVTTAVISGTISKFEAALASKEPEVQLTINCLDPWLKSPERVNVDVSGFDPADTTIEDELSTAPHGFRFEMSFSGATTQFFMEDTAIGWIFEVTPVDGFLIGDVLHFSSELGNRYLYVFRDEAPLYLADCLNPNSVWPIIFPGENKYTIDNSEYMTWEKISYYSTYWGV